MAGLARVTKAIKEANKAADRCVCGHKERYHTPLFAGDKQRVVCRDPFCGCPGFKLNTVSGMRSSKGAGHE